MRKKPAARSSTTRSRGMRRACSISAARARMRGARSRAAERICSACDDNSVFREVARARALADVDVRPSAYDVRQAIGLDHDLREEALAARVGLGADVELHLRQPVLDGTEARVVAVVLVG